MRLLFRPVVLSILLATVSCLNPQGGLVAEATVPVKTLYSSVFSPGASTMPQAMWIGTPKALADHWKNLHSYRLGAVTPPPPEVDWETSVVLLVQMGRKPTGGYGLELARPQARVEEGNAMVNLHWIEPSPSALTTQVITHPCLLLEIKRGAYQSMVVLDQTGQLRARASLP